MNSIRRPPPTLLLLAVAFGPALSATAQAPVRTVSGEPVCSSCRIVLDTIGIVGSLEDSVLIRDRIGGMVVLPGDTILVGGTMFGGGGNMVFAPDGRLVRTIGTSGEGPGELLPEVGVAPYDQDEVLVTQTGRLSRMDTSGEVSEEATLSLQSAYSLTAGPDGRVLYSFPRRNQEGAMRFEIFGPDLERVAAFDPVGPDEGDLCSACSSRETTWSTSRPGHFWAANHAVYRMTLWSDTGEPVEVLRVRGSGWLDAEEEPMLPEHIRQMSGISMGSRYPTPRPDPVIADLHQDSAGLLWVTGRATPEDWEPFPGGLPPMTPVNASPEIVAWRERHRAHAVIEVLDPRGGLMLASRTFEHLPLVATGGRHYYLKQQDDLGVVSYVVMRARLEGS